MQNKNQISLTRKFLYGVMLLGVFLSAFGGGSLPAVRARGGRAETPSTSSSTLLKWVEYRDKQYGYGFAIPSTWTIYPTPIDGFIASAIFMNYEAAKLTGKESWPTDAVKIEMQVFNITVGETATSWFQKHIKELTLSQDNRSLLSWVGSIENISIGKHNAVKTIIKDDQSNLITMMALKLANEQVLLISIFPENNWASVDVNLIVNSLSISPEEVVQLPLTVPAPLAVFESIDLQAQVIHPCDWGNEVGGSPIGLQMPFSSGTTWIVGGGGYFYGDGTHTGNDYYATDWNMSTNETGQPVYPVAGGVASIYYGTTGYGNYVDVVHDGGQVKTRYGHLSAISVSNGAPVFITTKIGEVGTSGNSTAPHLHLSFWYNVNGGWNSTYGQGRRPSPMQTSAGSWELCDGQSRTVADKGSVTDNPPAGYTKCADEGGTCSFNGTADVVYGARNSFTSPRSFTNSVACNNDVFGDPISSVGKSCYYKITTPPPPSCPTVSGEVRLYDLTNCEGTPTTANATGLWDYSSTFNDKAESIAIPGGWSARLYQNNNENSGESACFGGTDPNLNDNTFANGGTVGGNTTWMRVYSNSTCTPDLTIDGATFVSQSPYLTVTPGQSFQIYFQVRNTGTSTWQPGSYWLQNLQYPLGANSQQALSQTVAPNGLYTWTINEVAPTTSGTYRSQWMVNHNGTNFGPNMYIDVTVSPSSQTLTVGKAGTGTGTVMSSPAGINCGGTCSYAFAYNTLVTLTATPTAGHTFGGWSGGVCSGTGTCTVTMNAAKSITATFVSPPPFANFDAWPQNGTAPLTSAMHIVNMSNISSCSWNYGDGQTSTTCTQLHNHVYNNSGSYTVSLTVTGPGGSDSMTRTGYITVLPNTLTVSKIGTGSGTVTSSPAGINCGTACSYAFNYNTVITMTATPTSPSTFGGWSGGGCSGTGTCVVTMSAAQSVTATFNPPGNQTLTISKAGLGSGVISSTPAGINCGGTCSYAFAYNTLVTLTATPTTGHTFGGWSGGVCSGTGTCTVTMNTAKSVTATFNVPNQTLTVAKTGTGTGTVISSPAGINCGTACSYAYTYNTVVTLTPAPKPMSVFSGWSGACTGTGTCTVTMSTAKSVTATFTFRPVKGDYTGDGKADVAVFRPSNNTWYIKGAAGTTIFGVAGDIPVPADYNGDGKMDIAQFRPSSGTWFVKDQPAVVYGTAGDIPIAADYNGDFKAEIAVYRPSTATWYIKGQTPFVYGNIGDKPVVADYNGDGKADIAVFRPSTSTWYIKDQDSYVYGGKGDIPVVADYSGDGKADIAIFRPSNSTWYIRGMAASLYGGVGDIPVVGDYNGDGKADIAVFRPSTSTWYIKGGAVVIYGAVGDKPV